MLRCGLFLCALVGGLSLARPVRAHGDMHARIAEVTRQLEAELRKPPYPDAGHERSKFYLERAELHRMHGEWSKAAADYDQAARWEPDDEMVELCRGKMLLESGEPQRARPVLERFLAKRVDHPEALMLHAQALVQLGWGVNAVRYLDRALKRHPQPEPDHYLARVEVLAGLGKHHLPRAVQGLDEGIWRLGPIVSLDEKGIDLDVKLRRWSSALARVDRQAARSLRKDIWLARRAEVLDQAGRKAEARQARAEALEAMASLPAPLQARPATVSLKQRLLAAQTP